MRMRTLWLAGISAGVSLACVLLTDTPTSEPVPPTATFTHTLPIPSEETLTPISGMEVGDTWVRPEDGMVMIFVPEGEFSMGLDVDQSMQHCGETCSPDWFVDEEPVHRLRLNAYWIDRIEVTNDMYARCVADGACSPPEHFAVIAPVEYYYDGHHGEFPVVYVSWFDAAIYCAWAEARLPTEAEWEKAARGMDGRIFPWGDNLPTDELVSYFGAQEEIFAKVGSYPAGASPYGALDLAGNVLEWVADWYDAGYYSQTPLENPTGPASGIARVVRGGFDYGYDLRSSERSSASPESTEPMIGFRCARDGTAP